MKLQEENLEEITMHFNPDGDDPIKPGSGGNTSGGNNGGEKGGKN